MNNTLKILAILLALFSAQHSFANNIRQENWPETDFSTSSIALDKVIYLGQPKEYIPPVNAPSFKPVNQIHIADSEPVVTVELNGQARAYPLRILMWHNVVNDIFEDVPLLISYSPLSSSVNIFERKINDKILKFSATGNLYKSNRILYDQNTKSWWQQYTGEAIVGKLTGTKLNKIPTRVESLRLFKERFPEGEVLVPNNKIFRAYGKNPYVGYDTGFPFLYNFPYTGKFMPMTYVVVANNEAWPLADIIWKGYAVKDNIVIKWIPGQNSTLNSSDISIGSDIGNIIVQKRQSDGSFIDIPYNVTFAFIFNAFNPDGILNWKNTK